MYYTIGGIDEISINDFIPCALTTAPFFNMSEVSLVLFSEHTISLCPDCRKVVPARIARDNGNLYMHKICKEHGKFTSLYWRDADLYEYIYHNMPKHNICESPVCVDYTPCNRHFEKSTTIMLHITDLCNYSCPLCFADSNNKIYNEPTIEDIERTLPDIQGNEKPSVVIIGGEPTLRDDLPDIIKIIKKKGYYPRLATNGSRLANREYLKELKDAGLEWIILQFDGLSEEIYKKLRGKELLTFKEKLIDILDESGFKIHLAIMTVNGINSDSSGDILKYSLKKKGILWISFYPYSEIYRNELNVEDTHISDVITSLDKNTNGMIKRDDFLNMIKLMNFLFRLTKKEVFRTKITTLPLILVSDKKGMYPITKFFSPLFVLKKFSLALKTLLNFKKIISFRKNDPPANVLFLVIEKFHNYTNLDFKEASNCHMCYMIKDGFVAYDTFNALYRKKDLW